MSNLINRFRKQRVFSIVEAQAAFKSERQSLIRLIHYYVQNGKLKRIRRGLYCVIEDASASPNPYAIAARITRPYYLAYHSALELHGVAYSAARYVYVASAKIFPKFRFEEVEYFRLHPLNGDLKTGIEERLIENTKVRTSDHERTIIDCLDRIGYAGGVEEAIKSLRNFPSVDVEKILAYLAVFKRKILYAKTGWLLELMQTEWHISEASLRACEKKVSKRPMYLMPGSAKVIHQPRWNLLLPANIDALLQGV